MNIYKPDDILDFGKNEGILLSNVYKYQPSYIEWAIETIPDFKIDISAFEDLPNPTPGNYNKNAFSKEIINKPIHDLSEEEMFEQIKRSDSVNQLKNITAATWEEIEKKSNQSFETIDYKFPDRIKIINNQKE